LWNYIYVLIKLVLLSSDFCQQVSDSSANQHLWITDMLERM